jgi:hypothetical protein
MAGKRRLHDDDDGRVIANMNVDGMPWYQRSERFDKHRREQASDFSDLTKEETREIVKGALKASLMIAGVFILAMFLFILFCLYVWF